MFIIILILFNILIIIILSNTETPFVKRIKALHKYKIHKTLMLPNRDISISEIEINKYHPIEFEEEIK